MSKTEIAVDLTPSAIELDGIREELRMLNLKLKNVEQSALALKSFSNELRASMQEVNGLVSEFIHLVNETWTRLNNERVESGIRKTSGRG